MNNRYADMNEKFAENVRKDSEAKELRKRIKKYERMIDEIKPDIDKEKDEADKINLYRALGIFHELIKNKGKEANELEKEVNEYLERENLI